MNQSAPPGRDLARLSERLGCGSLSAELIKGGGSNPTDRLTRLSDGGQWVRRERQSVHQRFVQGRTRRARFGHFGMLATAVTQQGHATFEEG